LRVQPDPEGRRVRLAFILDDVLIGNDEVRPQRPSFQRMFAVVMPPDLEAIAARGPEYYLVHRGGGPEATRLRNKLPNLQAGIRGEIHARASFAVACFILVMIGSALGMMFRAAGTLSAFAVSVVPAFLCIALAATGQHVAEADANNLRLGLGIIWSGNALVGLLAAGLLGALWRQ
jgi:hypothetical protein